MKTTIEQIKEWIIAIIILAILIFSGISAYNARVTPLHHQIYEEIWKRHDTIYITTVYVSRIDDIKSYVKRCIDAKSIMLYEGH